jgi:hypothetical protein
MSSEAATPPVLDYATLVEAIDESGLIDRVRDYFREAHPDGRDVSRGILLNEWAVTIYGRYLLASKEKRRRLVTRAKPPPPRRVLPWL